MAYLKGYMVPPGAGGCITLTEQEYTAMKNDPTQSDPVQHTGVYDPNKYFFITNMNDEGWVVTEGITGLQGTSADIVFDVNQSGHGGANCGSILPTSLIRIVAEEVDANNTHDVYPVYARISSQNTGTATVKHDTLRVLSLIHI